MRFTKITATLSALLTTGAIVIAACGEKQEPRVDRRPSAANTSAPVESLPTQVPPVQQEPAAVAVVPAPPPIAEPAPPASYREALARGKQLRGEGAYDDAIAALEIAREMKPSNGTPHVELARVYLERHEAARARQHAEEAVDLWPSGSSAWNTLGRVELMEGDLEAAVVSFERAAEENEDNSYAWNNLGYTLIRLGRFDEASEALERAVSGEVVAAYMWNNLGMAYEHVDRVVEARAAYGKARDGGSSSADANFARLEGVTSVAAVIDEDSAEEGSTTE